MKKMIGIFVAAILMAGGLLACGSADTRSASDAGSQGNPDAASDHEKLQIVTTIFPEYDWVQNILGENPADAEVTMLLDSGVDLHSFQPTAEDILKISTCDLFIYVGGESDEWVEDALQEAANENMVVINLLDSLGDAVKEEELVEGMQEEHEHEEETEYDEHVWLSLRNASALIQNISAAVQNIDPENADIYQSNSDAYAEKLNALEAEYQAAAADAPLKTLLFGDRFPFRYLTDDCGLDYYAAFVGCSAETEASFETIMFLANKVDELSLHSVMTIENSDQKIAETIVQNTKTKDARILTMDSMQSVSAADVQNGASYLSIMESNLAVLKDALK